MHLYARGVRPALQATRKSARKANGALNVSGDPHDGRNSLRCPRIDTSTLSTFGRHPMPSTRPPLPCAF